MIDRKRLRSDAIKTAPWVASVKNISTETLSFIVFHGGGNPSVEEAKGCPEALKKLGNRKTLELMAANYRRSAQ
jgi:hypothetical protein